jgi:hypothetical protein
MNTFLKLKFQKPFYDTEKYSFHILNYASKIAIILSHFSSKFHSPVDAVKIETAVACRGAQPF